VDDSATNAFRVLATLLQIRAFQSGSNAIKAEEEQMGFERRAAFLFLDEPEGIYSYFY